MCGTHSTNYRNKLYRSKGNVYRQAPTVMSQIPKTGTMTFLIVSLNHQTLTDDE